MHLGPDEAQKIFAVMLDSFIIADEMYTVLMMNGDYATNNSLGGKYEVIERYLESPEGVERMGNEGLD